MIPVRLCPSAYIVGEFTCIQVVFTLSRNIGFYIIQLYVPSALTVMLSWVSFWLDARSVPARISLGVLTILTIITQSSGFSQSLPKVSYVKAVDIWTTMCLIFVFLALVEYACLNSLLRKTEESRKYDPGQAGSSSSIPQDSTETLNSRQSSVASVIATSFTNTSQRRSAFSPRSVPPIPAG